MAAGIDFALPGCMSTAFAIVYQYRQLQAKCESHLGLSLDEIEQLSTLRDELVDYRAAEAQGELRSGRASKTFNDPVSVLAIGLETALCAGAPYFDEGQAVELRVRDGGHSYRIAARVEWQVERDDDSYDIGLELVGAPVLVRHRQPTWTEEIASAA